MKNTIKKIGALVALGAFLASAKPALTKDLKVNVSANTTIASDYVTRAGFVVGDGPVNQNTISANYGNLSAFVWNNYDLGDKEMKEVEVGVGYNHKINDKVSSRLSVQHWEYPSSGGHNDVVESGIHYSGKVETDMILTHLMSGDSKGGNMIHLKIAKPFQLKDATLTPNVNATYLDDFFGLDGVSKTYAGISASKKIGDFNVEVSYGKQFGKQGLDSKPHGSISIGKNF